MRRISFAFALLFISLTITAKVSVTQLRTENMTAPLGLDTKVPRFSWQIVSDQKNVVQTAYQIVVTSDDGELWNTGKVSSNEQLWIPYQGKPLHSNQHATWRVKVFTNRGETEWSEPQPFSIGLLGECHWTGRWIGIEGLQTDEQAGLHSRLAARYLRKEFSLKEKTVKRATAFVAGVGLYECYVNGHRLGAKQMLAPVPSDYRKTIYYNTFDVTPLLTTSQGCVGIVLGNGRYFPMRQEKAYKSPVFGFPKCRINIIIEYTDGTRQVVATDEKWKLTFDGPIRSNNEYDGEEYDARKALGNWTMPGYDDSRWQKAQRVAIPSGTLRGQMTPNMTWEQTILPKKVYLTQDKQSVIIDFGQNTAGMVAVKVRGQAGDTITIRYAEKLQSRDTLYVANLRNALSRDIYICNGRESGEWWQSTFAYHGFRYVQVSGLKHAQASDFEARVVSDEMSSTGMFECSDPTLTQVVKNAWWGIKSNYKGMPVDCPQRNERQPWLGDRTMGSLGESFLFDNECLYTKWMRDICESQREDGVICDVAPAFWNYYNDDVTWPAVLPFSCEMIYRQYGNKQSIIDSYPYIKRWINHVMEEYTDDGIITKDQYGDWCVPPESLELIHSKDPARQTSGALISTAYTIRVLQLMEQFAQLQGLTDEADYWAKQRQTMTEAFNRKFLIVRRGTSPRPGHVLYPDSVFYGNNTATANLLPLAFGIVPTDCQEEVVKNIVENIIIKNNAHVSCGVIGISWLLRGLSDHGFADVAYMIATNKSYPSWGYMAENGATTIWELWNGNTANPAMNSGNHVMLLGDLLTWCYQYLGGIRQEGEAYRHLVLKPSFDIQDCSWVNVSYQTPYGEVVSHWKKDLQHLSWTVTIPCNTTADICLPDGRVEKVGSGTYTFQVDIPTSHPAIVKDQFLYEKAPFPQCHSGSIVELKNGDLVATYFGGKHERNPDVCIWVSIKKKGKDEWTAPILAADGVFDWGRKACWNPVITQMPNGELWLFFKIGTKVADWTGWVVKSRDGGRTWTKREPLPEGFLGPVKNKPEIINDRLICGTSTETNGWKLHFEILDLKDGAWKKKAVADLPWKYVGPVPAEMAYRCEDMLKVTKKNEKEDIEAPDAGGVADKDGRHPIDCIQPSILKLKDGRLQVLMRTRNGKLATSFSSDGGDTWTKVTLTDVPNNQSGTDAVTLKDGRHVLIYNDFETLPGTKKGVRTPVSIALSDDGTHWRHVLTLEDSPISQYSYPCIIQGRDGTLHCLYTWRRLRMAYKQIDLKKLP